MSSLQSHIPGYFLREPIQRSFRHSELGLDVSLLFFQLVGRIHRDRTRSWEIHGRCYDNSDMAIVFNAYFLTSKLRTRATNMKVAWDDFAEKEKKKEQEHITSLLISFE